MKVVNSEGIYRIYKNDLKTYDSLPAQTYTVKFNKLMGFYLEEHPQIEIKEKIYGCHLAKVNKVLNAFKIFERNLGVILSGDKGIGKSLFAKLLSIQGIKQGLPLIIINEYMPGIASFIEEIEQEAIFLFDEFDKTFHDKKNETDPQASLLTLFDGLAQGKKLFVITCNELRRLNDYLINRPGRFHYHFRFEYPSKEEVEEYLKDFLNEQYWYIIPEVVSFSQKIKLNYDCLRAIAFELNTGESFSNAVKDLNIVNIEPEIYDCELHFDNGLILYSKGCSMNLFGDHEVTVYLNNIHGRGVLDVFFNTADCVYDSERFVTVVTSENIHQVWVDDETNDTTNLINSGKMTQLILKRKLPKALHYLV